MTLANAVGNGIADDKVIYRFVPDLIRYYLSEAPILGQVQTYLPVLPDDLHYIEQHARDMVLKSANESGGYGMLIGSQSTHAERSIPRPHARGFRDPSLPNERWRSPVHRAGSTAASPGATSTCGPSPSMAPACVSSRAA